MTGEHFSSATGKELDKSKDPYVRFRWREKKLKRGLATVIEKDKLQQDKDLWLVLQTYYNVGKSGICPECGLRESLPSVNFEFYNWEKPKTEIVCTAHEKCLKETIKAKLDALKLLGKNPTCNIELNCLSVENCGFFSKASGFRNCGHIVLKFEEETEHNPDGSVSIHMRPLLYCKRAHPGVFELETEADTWWNIQEAGLALIAKNMVEMLESPEAKAQLENLKKQHPEYIEGLRKLIRQSPLGFAWGTAFAAIAETYILEETPEKTYEELWDELVKHGNDYY